MGAARLALREPCAVALRENAWSFPARVSPRTAVPRSRGESSPPAGPNDPPVLVGTSGYVFPDWVGHFYPKGTKSEDMLRFYAQVFPVVEVNTSYYRMPDVALFERMSARTPASFQFMVKAYKGMTHDPSEWKGGEVCGPFLDSLAPLQHDGKLAGVLAQFPGRSATRKRTAVISSSCAKGFPERSFSSSFAATIGSRIPCSISCAASSWAGAPWTSRIFPASYRPPIT